jgi:hypothetical protein
MLQGVIPAKAGIQSLYTLLDPGLRRGACAAGDKFLDVTAFGPIGKDPRMLPFGMESNLE